MDVSANAASRTSAFSEEETLGGAKTIGAGFVAGTDVGTERAGRGGGGKKEETCRLGSAMAVADAGGMATPGGSMTALYGDAMVIGGSLGETTAEPTGWRCGCLCRWGRCRRGGSCGGSFGGGAAVILRRRLVRYDTSLLLLPSALSS